MIYWLHRSGGQNVGCVNIETLSPALADSEADSVNNEKSIKVSLWVRET